MFVRFQSSALMHEARQRTDTAAFMKQKCCIYVCVCAYIMPKDIFCDRICASTVGSVT